MEHFRFNIKNIKPKAGRRALKDVRAYQRRTRERDLRHRTPLRQATDYIAREYDLTAAHAEVGYHKVRLNGYLGSADSLFAEIDQKARNKSGEYCRNGGHYPRLGSFMTGSIPYGVGLEEAKTALDSFLTFLAETFGCASEAVIHLKEGRPDHFHAVVTDRLVSDSGVGAKIRAFNAKSQRAAGNGIVAHDGRLLCEATVSMRQTWARLMSDASGKDISAESFASRGLGIEPVKYWSRREICDQERDGRSDWRQYRARELADREAVLNQRAAPLRALISKPKVDRAKMRRRAMSAFHFLHEEPLRNAAIPVALTREPLSVQEIEEVRTAAETASVREMSTSWLTITAHLALNQQRENDSNASLGDASQESGPTSDLLQSTARLFAVDLRNLSYRARLNEQRKRRRRLAFAAMATADVIEQTQFNQTATTPISEDKVSQSSVSSTRPRADSEALVASVSGAVPNLLGLHYPADHYRKRRFRTMRAFSMFEQSSNQQSRGPLEPLSSTTEASVSLGKLQNSSETRMIEGAYLDQILAKEWNRQREIKREAKERKDSQERAQAAIDREQKVLLETAKTREQSERSTLIDHEAFRRAVEDAEAERHKDRLEAKELRRTNEEDMIANIRSPTKAIRPTEAPLSSPQTVSAIEARRFNADLIRSQENRLGSPIADYPEQRMQEPVKEDLQAEDRNEIPPVLPGADRLEAVTTEAATFDPRSMPRHRQAWWVHYAQFRFHALLQPDARKASSNSVLESWGSKRRDRPSKGELREFHTWVRTVSYAEYRLWLSEAEKLTPGLEPRRVSVPVATIQRKIREQDSNGID